MKSKESAPTSKAFWQDQNTSVFPPKLCEKSDVSDGFWPIPLTASTHQLVFPPRAAKLPEFVSQKLLPRLLFGSHRESDALILQKKTFSPSASVNAGNAQVVTKPRQQLFLLQSARVRRTPLLSDPKSSALGSQEQPLPSHGDAKTRRRKPEDGGSLTHELPFKHTRPD